MENALAYYDTATIMDIKKLYSLGSRGNLIIKLFMAVFNSVP